MITDIDAFLRYFDAVHRRALREIGATTAIPKASSGLCLTMRSQQLRTHQARSSSR